MTLPINCQRKKSVLLELISDKRLTDLQKSSDLLFTGKIAVKSEGGFKKLYELPTPALLNRLKRGSMSDVLSVRVKHQGWLCNRDSGKSSNMCVLFANQGLLFIYNKPTKGYVVKLSHALKLEISCGRKKILPEDTQAEECRLKFGFGFGSIEIQLTKGQIEKWRLPLLNAFDGKSPCFETSEIHKEEMAMSHADSNAIGANDSTCTADNLTSNADSQTALPISSQLTVSLNFSESSCDSLFSPTSSMERDLNDNDMAKFFRGLKEIGDKHSTPPRSEACTESNTDVINKDRDSGIGSDDETAAKTKNAYEFRPVPAVRFSKLPVTSVTSTSPKFRKTDTAFNLPVYRLETEREKPRRVPQTRIAEKIRYFEEILGKECINNTSDSHEK